MTDSARLTEIEQRANAATEGPWTWEDAYEMTTAEWAGVGDQSLMGRLLSAPGRFVLGHASYWQIRESEAAFIAHARTDIPWLLAELERTQERTLRALLRRKERCVVSVPDANQIDNLRERISGYVTALMVDERSVAACEKAMDEALDALAADLRQTRERAARLEGFVAHKPACILSISNSPLAQSDWCDCGLRAVLSVEDAPGVAASDEDTGA